MSQSCVGELCLMAFLAVYAVAGNSNTPNDYVTYLEGDFPLIISSPHGGNITPKSIPDRHNGCRIDGKCVYDHECRPQSTRCRVVTLRDTSTKEIAISLYDRIHHLTGRKPYLIINELHRSKLDANRALEQATFNNREAVEAYGNYTLSIYKARTLIGLKSDEQGLFVDIHGQSHSEEWTELGYRIKKEALNSDSIPLDTSSIRALIARKCGSDAACAKDLISGGTSLGHFLEAEGHKVVPAPSIPSPGNGSYYTGGYNTESYGSRCGDIDAIQIEIARHIRFGEWEWFANQLGDAILSFMEVNGYVESRSADTTMVPTAATGSSAPKSTPLQWIVLICVYLCADRI